jgi:hypothetical protein
MSVTGVLGRAAYWVGDRLVCWAERGKPDRVAEYVWNKGKRYAVGVTLGDSLETNSKMVGLLANATHLTLEELGRVPDQTPQFPGLLREMTQRFNLSAHPTR